MLSSFLMVLRVIVKKQKRAYLLQVTHVDLQKKKKKPSAPVCVRSSHSPPEALCAARPHRNIRGHEPQQTTHLRRQHLLGSPAADSTEKLPLSCADPDRRTEPLKPLPSSRFGSTFSSSLPRA